MKLLFFTLAPISLFWLTASAFAENHLPDVQKYLDNPVASGTSIATRENLPGTNQLFRVTSYTSGITLTQRPGLVADLFGSAVTVGQQRDNCILLTAWHVVQDAERIELTHGEGEQEIVHVADLLISDPARDLALLRMQLSHSQVCHPVSMLENQPNRGEAVILYGNPAGSSWVVSRGIVSGSIRLPSSTEVLLTDARAAPGFSGGPLLLENGLLAGLVVGIQNTGLPTGFTYAIPSPQLADFLRRSLGDDWKNELGVIGVHTQELAKLGLHQAQEGQSTSGILVESVEPDSLGERAGLRGGEHLLHYNGINLSWGGDIIVAVNNKPLETHEEAERILAHIDETQPVVLNIYRRGRPMVITLQPGK
ncbi:MAG: S1C family serine protease [Candidatus Thiodiazotropha sp.]